MDLSRVVHKTLICFERPVFYTKWYHGTWSPLAIMFLSVQRGLPETLSPCSPCSLRGLQETQSSSHELQPAHREIRGLQSQATETRASRGGKGLEEKEREDEGLEINSQPAGWLVCGANHT